MTTCIGECRQQLQERRGGRGGEHLHICTSERQAQRSWRVDRRYAARNSLCHGLIPPNASKPRYCLLFIWAPYRELLELEHALLLSNHALREPAKHRIPSDTIDIVLADISLARDLPFVCCRKNVVNTHARRWWFKRFLSLQEAISALLAM